MSQSLDDLKEWVNDVARLIAAEKDPDLQHYHHFLQEPDLALGLIDLIDGIVDEDSEDERAFYSACIFALDLCVAQLQTGVEGGNKLGEKTLFALMSRLAQCIRQAHHGLGFWLPILNAFYEVHVELSPDLKDAYLDLANDDEEYVFESDETHLEAIRDMINEFSELSAFDLAENFFAQSYAMPPDFFADLIIDLYSIEEGKEIALLTLLHPKAEVRDVVVATLDHLMPQLTLSSRSLSRLKVIKQWYPPEYHEQFNNWIKLQRRKGVVFAHDIKPATILQIKASEIDGAGAQGIFVHIRHNRKHHFCGLLVKQDVGIKDAWITEPVPAKEVSHYFNDSFEGNVTLRDVSFEYLTFMLNHFLATTFAIGSMPNLHLFEIQELLGLHLQAEWMNVPQMLQELSVQIIPFTEEALHSSLQRTKLWSKNKSFTESWYIENVKIDQIVNRYSTIVDGVKVCRASEAMVALFEEAFEPQRLAWVFHFLWVALWFKAKAKKTEKFWQDSFMIAHALHNGMDFNDIPLMQEICGQTIVNSIETMNERRTHLN